MRIALLSTFYPFRGGIAQFNANLYKSLEKNHEVKAYTFKRQYPDLFFPGKSQFVTKGDNADVINSVPLLDTLNPLTYKRTAKGILNFKPDLLIMKFWMPYFALPFGSVSKRLKKNGIINITILDNVIPHEKRPGDLFLTKYFLNQNHGFVVMSNIVKNDLLELKPDAKYIIHPHPVYNHFGKKLKTSESRTYLSIPQNKKAILFFGFIRDYKGLDSLIEAMKNLTDEYLLLIAGEVYGDFKKYENIINKYSLQNKIKLFIRYIPDNEVPAFFSAADVCVLPYKSATQSGITGIAYHFELPLIVSKSGGLKEIIQEDKTGLVLPQLSPENISETIKEYFENNLKTKFQENIRKYKSKYSWDRLTEAIVEFYNELK